MFSAVAGCEGRVPLAVAGMPCCPQWEKLVLSVGALEMPWKKQVPWGLVFPEVEKQVPWGLVFSRSGKTSPYGTWCLLYISRSVKASLGSLAAFMRVLVCVAGEPHD